MRGHIKKLDSSGESIYPVTLGSAVYLSKDVTIEKKIRELEDLIKNNGGLNWLTDVDTDSVNSGDVLTNIKGVWKAKSLGGNMNIELEQWGIVPGLPTKPYIESDYKKAFDNVEAINKALVHAKEKGYSQATLPRGDYSICYPVSIKLQSNLTLDLGGSNIKVMFESDTRSPFDRSSNPTYSFAGNAFELNNVMNAHLTNGNIIGDVYERTFVNSSETAEESTYGVSINSGSAYCSVSHCDIHGFMGDNVVIVSGGRKRGGYTTGSTLGDINGTTGIATPNVAATSMYTPLLSIPVDQNYKTLSIGGQGVARMTAMTNKNFDVFFYKEDNSFLGVLSGRRPQVPIPLPILARKFRMKFYDETDPTKDMQIFLNWGSDAHHNVVEYNDLYNGHRGGLQLGGSYNIIQHNTIRDNGKFGEVFLDGVPTFPDTTRYAINQEDSFGDNSIVQFNHFSGGFHGLLLRANSIMVEGNVFNNIGSAILIYSVDYATIRSNYSMSGGVRLLGGSSEGKIVIQGNYFTSMDIEHPDYDCICTDNHIMGTIQAGKSVFERNNITLLADGYFISGKNIVNNKFMTKKGDTVKNKNLYVSPIDENSLWEKNQFSNLILNITAISGIMTLKDCKFTNCTIITTTAPTNLTVEIKNSELIDTFLEPRSSSITTKDTLKFNIIGSSLTVSAASALKRFIKVTSGNASDMWKVKIHSCNFKTDDPLVVFIMDFHYGYNNMITVEWKNNSFEYTGAGTLFTKYYIADTRVFGSIIADNKIKNLVFSNYTDPKHIKYDPEVKAIAEPISGFYNASQIVYNATPTAGGFLGWVALNEGYANNVAWSSSTAYTVGQMVNSGGNVYKCSISGTSGVTAPTHTTGTATDGTVTWEYQGLKVVFKQYGLISS